MTLHELIAEKIERDPALLRIPIENIDRWLTGGHPAPHRLEQWRAIILRAVESREGLEALIALLRDPASAAQRQRDFAPFAGVLTAAERSQAEPECACNF